MVVPVTRVLIGVALIAGAFIRLAAFGGALQMLMFYLGGWEGELLALFDSTLIYARTCSRYNDPPVIPPRSGVVVTGSIYRSTIYWNDPDAGVNSREPTSGGLSTNMRSVTTRSDDHCWMRHTQFDP